MGTGVFTWTETITHTGDLPFPITGRTDEGVAPVTHRALSRRPTGPVQRGLGSVPDGSTSASVSTMLPFELAAEAGDEGVFVAALGAALWEERTAADLSYLVRLALKAGAHLAARHLASRGAELYPQNSDLKRMAALLAPPRVRREEAGHEEARRLNRAWIEQHREEFLARWVALRHGRLVATAPSPEELGKLLHDTVGACSPDMLIAHIS
jgi:hypothetical protein